VAAEGIAVAAATTAVAAAASTVAVVVAASTAAVVVDMPVVVVTAAADTTKFFVLRNPTFSGGAYQLCRCSLPPIAPGCPTHDSFIVMGGKV